MKKVLSAEEYREICLADFDDEQALPIENDWSRLEKKLYSKEYEERVLAIMNGRPSGLDDEYDIKMAEIAIGTLEKFKSANPETVEEMKQRYQDTIDKLTMKTALE